jgi:hypothetical protein
MHKFKYPLTFLFLLGFKLLYFEENTRITKQLTAAKEEKQMLLRRLHEIETRLNAVASNLPPSTDLDALAVRFKKRGYSPVVLPRR